MYPHAHFIGAVLAGLIARHWFQLSNAELLIIGILTVLIDLDHYAYYIITKKDTNPKRFLNYTASLSNLPGYHLRTIVHRLPGMIAIFPLLILLYLAFPTAGLIGLLAYGSHMLLDWVSDVTRKIALNRKFSVAGIDLVMHPVNDAIAFMMLIACLILF